MTRFRAGSIACRGNVVRLDAGRAGGGPEKLAQAGSPVAGSQVRNELWAGIRTSPRICCSGAGARLAAQQAAIVPAVRCRMKRLHVLQFATICEPSRGARPSHSPRPVWTSGNLPSQASETSDAPATWFPPAISIPACRARPGRGGRDRTSEWRNQKLRGPLHKSTRILKHREKPTLGFPIGYIAIRNASPPTDCQIGLEPLPGLRARQGKRQEQGE